MKYIRKKFQSINHYYKFLQNFGLTFVSSLVKGKKTKTVLLFSKPINYTNRFWFLHSMQELFIEKVYLFKSSSESPCILDCGANIGLSVIFFKQLFPKARIKAFEPDPMNFEVMHKNIASFDFANVELFNKAVWSKDDRLKFSSYGSVGSKLSSSQPANAKSTIEVAAVPLSAYLNEPIDFLKIDIEGAEYEVLLSCEQYLHNVKNIFIEYHSLPDEPQMLGDLLKILTREGFRYYIRQAWENFKHPYVNRQTKMFDVQLNIFAFR
jgi:FkbM family methyltransferase